MSRTCLAFALAILAALPVSSQEPVRSQEPVSSQESELHTRPVLRVDGDELQEGELQLLLQESRVADRSATARQAAAAVLIRRHLAMKSLQSLGGQALESIIDRELAALEKQASAQGSSLDAWSRSRQVSLAAFQRHLAWQIAWRQYLKSRMTDAALRAFYERDPDRYGGKQFLVSQIFLQHPSPANATDASEQTLQSIARTLQNQPDAAASFALLAKQHSEAASAERGGEVGWVDLDGDLPGEVMSAVRAASVGDVVGPLRSALGWHLVLVSDARSVTTSYDALADATQLRSDFSDALFADLVRRQASAAVEYLDARLQPNR